MVLVCREIEGTTKLAAVEDVEEVTVGTKGTNETVLRDPVNVCTPEFIKVDERVDKNAGVSADTG